MEMTRPKFPRHCKPAKPKSSTASAKPIDRQPFQFRLAGMLWLMTGLAIATAVVTPFLRQWTTSHWQYFGIAVLAFGVAALGGVAIHLTQTSPRQTSIERVGTPALRIKTVALFPQSFLAYLQTNSPNYFLAVMFGALLIPAAELHLTARLSPGPFAILCTVGLNGLNLWTALSWCFAHQEIVLGPYGLVLGEDFHPWTSIRATADDGCVRLALGKAMKLRVDLTPEELATVRAWYRAAKK